MFELLHAASRWFESFADRHQHGIAAIGVVATTAATIVALWAAHIARAASQPKLKASVEMLQIIDQGTNLDAIPTYLALRLTNVGSVQIKFNTNLFAWRLPRHNKAWLAMPMDQQGDGIVYERRYPFVLPPHTSETVFLSSLERFREVAPKLLTSPWLTPRIAARLLRSEISTDGSGSFRATVSKDVRSEIEKGMASSPG